MNIFEDTKEMSNKLDNNNLKEILSPYGKYVSKEKNVYLYKNETLNNPEFREIMNKYKFNIQVNLL